jgi:hypothetical protein
MARDRLGSLLNETATATGTLTGTWYDLGGGTPSRGLPIAWNQQMSCSAGTITQSLTLEASDTTASAQETVGQFTTVNSNATPYGQETKTIHTRKRYLRAIRVLTASATSVSAISGINTLDVTGANPT